MPAPVLPASVISTPSPHGGKTAIVFTGGTIGMELDGDGAVRPAPALADPAALLAEMPGPFPDGVELLPVHWANLPSPHMTPTLMFRLAGDVQALLDRPDIRGVIVTHGTDVMEETAFMLDLLLGTPKPVLITGSMRSHGEAGYDGIRNLASAVRACALPLPAGLGVVLLMTDKIFAAREVTKVHSMGVDAFDAPGAGPLGSCVAGSTRIFRMPVPHEPLRARCLEPLVDLVTMAPGMGGYLLAAARDHGAKGLVVEGFGAGNVPPSALREIRACVEADIPVVVTSRCIEGGVWPVYGYSGGANDLRDMGVILGGNLRAQKARILLMLALGLDAEPGPDGVTRKEASGRNSLAAVRRVFEMFPN